jgi:hypothetical protein
LDGSIARKPLRRNRKHLIANAESEDGAEKRTHVVFIRSEAIAIGRVGRMRCLPGRESGDLAGGGKEGIGGEGRCLAWRLG